MENMIHHAVEAALDEMELHYHVKEDIFYLVICSKESSFKFRIVAEEEADILAVIGLFPVNVPEYLLDRMCKAINDLNKTSPVGYYVIDPDDGEISFRVIQNTDSGAVNKEVVKTCLLMAAKSLMVNYERIMKAMYGGEQMTFIFGDSARESGKASA